MSFGQMAFNQNLHHSACPGNKLLRFLKVFERARLTYISNALFIVEYLTLETTYINIIEGLFAGVGPFCKRAI